MFCLGLHKQGKIIPCKMSLSPHLAEQFKTIQWFPCIMHVYALCGIGQPKGSQLDTHNKGHRMGDEIMLFMSQFSLIFTSCRVTVFFFFMIHGVLRRFLLHISSQAVFFFLCNCEMVHNSQLYVTNGKMHILHVVLLFVSWWGIVHS